MAFLRKRGDGFALAFWWKGKTYIKSLGTADEKVANRIKKDAEDQLKRIRNGKSPLAAQLLADGFKITDVLFGSPEVALRIGKNSPDDNPLPLNELVKAYLAQMPSTHSADHRYSVGLWLNKICEGIGPDRPVMTLTTADLEEYRKKRVGQKGQNTASYKKEITWLKVAIQWAVETKLLSSNPIPRWPTVKVQRRKRFEWRSDIEAMIASHEFKDDKEKQAFLAEMKARLVLTAEDMKALVKLAHEKMPDLELPLKLVCSTGIRRKELVTLKKADFDPKRGTIIVGSAKQSKTEEITYRNITINESVIQALREHQEALPKTERLLFPVFKESSPGYRGRWKQAGKDRKQTPERLRAERATRMLDELVKGTDFEMMSGWHCLRHSFISICVAKGLEWPVIAAWVGHMSQRTTKLYTYFETAESRKRMEALDISF